MHWKTVESEYIYRSPFGSLRKDKCQLPDGQVIDGYYVHEYSDWVNAVVITKDKQLVLVEQYRHAGNGLFLEIPAGKIEANETYEEGILREIREETGYTSETMPVLLGEWMVNPATQTNKIRSYLLVDAYQATEQELDDTEDIIVQLMNFENFGKLVKEGEITTQLFSISAYYLAKAFLAEK
ncbi:NUDIX domain-containing protein [Evansella caseinilytica]|uniref:NUDIX domain-containing protein n=1 Tax=Evansella caseinilytica TaxID=1503961 RepID=A0A1H3R3W3_9BACI|nr:NUDIX hydrolase [Evansella caseinilytica]SDZ20193.1 NUDIX domain-containing protein [Evansella caseinilytica]